MKIICLSILGIIFYFAAVHFFMEWIMTRLWIYVFGERKQHKITATIGVIDKFFYAISFAFGMYAFIGIWLGIKTASRLISNTDTEDDKKFIKEGQRKNLFIIGNAIALIFGIIGGTIIRVLFNVQIANTIEWWDKLLAI